MAIRSLTFTPDSQTLITASDDKRINIYDVENANCVSTLTGHQSWVLCVTASPNGTQFATGLLLLIRSSDKRVKIWDLVSRTCVHTFEGHTEQVWGVSYNDDGSRLASVGDDRSMIIYSL